MRLGVFSDIHGNMDAFNEVIASMELRSCDAYVFVGDICGYYYDQSAVIESHITLKNLYAVAGNHDRMFLRSLNDSRFAKEYEDSYGASFEFFRSKATMQMVNYIQSLPDRLELIDGKILVVHGSPNNPLDEYLYPDTDIERLSALGYKTIISGHTHYPMSRHTGSVHVINPGSVGQPRDRKDPSWGLYDTDTDEFDVIRVQYDNTRLKQQIFEIGEKNKYLLDILDRI